MFNYTIDYFSKKPRNLFLLDGIGAGLTTISLFFILRPYADFIGMPADSFTYLSMIGLVYCTYSLACYFLLKDYWTGCLRIIGIANFSYCILTMMLMYINYHDLTPIGLFYFFSEILIILSLVYLELKVANRLKAGR